MFSVTRTVGLNEGLRRLAATTLVATTLVAALIVSPRSGNAQGATQPAATPASPASPATPMAIVFAGEVRTRSEWDHPGGALPNDMFTYLRTRFGARVDAAPGVRLLLQAQDSRVLGAEAHASAALVETFGVHQGYVELRTTRRATALALRAGRQEIAIGNERLVGIVNWSNVGRSFDGARVTATREGATPGSEAWSATAFAATVEERGRHFGAGAPQQDHAMAGISSTTSMARGAMAEGTLLYDAGGSYRGFTNADRMTLEVRARTPRMGSIAAELEGAWQAGHQRDGADSTNVHRQSIRSWLAAARVGAFPGASSRASLLVGVDLLSGDEHAHDARYSAFSTMYASNHAFYGLMDVIGDPAATTRDRGLVDLLAIGSAALHPRFAMRGEVHRFGFSSGSGRDLGWEADVIVPVRLLPTATMDVGVSAFRAGHDASSVGLGTPGTVRDWAFLQLRVGF
jgi:hypothetical protein